jgi:hypothetical protein
MYHMFNNKTIYTVLTACLNFVFFLKYQLIFPPKILLYFFLYRKRRVFSVQYERIL